MKTILSFLPKIIVEHLEQIPLNQQKEIEEIRIRIHRPIELSLGGRTIFLPYLISEEDAYGLLNKISHHSIYALEEELRRGYITIDGGHRIGLAGKVILENGRVKALRNISSFNIRIAKEKIGIAESLLHALYMHGWQHTMIIGAPQTGKTTLLRDIARIISTGDPSRGIPAQKVGIVDERSEIAGCVNGVPQLTFGPRVDVLDACPKAEGMMMMIRSMSPEILVVDEIGRVEDTDAILEAVNAGIKLVITTHGESMEEIKKRPSINTILEQGIFQRFVELSRRNGPGTITKIRDLHGQDLSSKVRVT
jgi:stage III sporulation protein AA